MSWSTARATADDSRLEHLFTAAVDDLRHPLLRDPEDPTDVFAAAGTSRYLTSFPSARLAVDGPDDASFGTELASVPSKRTGQAPRSHRRRQQGGGARQDPPRLRRTAYLDPESDPALPPVYYGTVDATALWVTSR